MDAGVDQVFEIKRASRVGSPALIALWGPSFSGKTLSALKMARGLVGPNGKIGVIDTENRRALFYADEVGGWYHIDLQPPFTPARYRAALKSFEDKGDFGCIIIDSMSHVWEGEGGVLDMADSARTRDGEAMKGLAKWRTPKMEFKRTSNYLLRAPFHIIFCLRAKMGVKQKGDKIENTGITPICEKNFIFEMTLSVLLGPDHRPMFQPVDERFKVDPLVPAIKAPAAIWGAIKPDDYLSEKTGQTIAEWINAGATFDHEAESVKRIARDVAALGQTALDQHWKTLTKSQRTILIPIGAELRAIAAEADRLDNQGANQPGPQSQGDGDPLDDTPTPAKKNGNGHGDNTVLAAG